MKFSIKDFFAKFNQTHKKMWILSHLLKYLSQKTSFFASDSLNNLSPFMYFQSYHYFIYRVDDVINTIFIQYVHKVIIQFKSYKYLNLLLLIIFSISITTSIASSENLLNTSERFLMCFQYLD